MGEHIHTTPIAYRDIDLSWMIGRSLTSVAFHDPIPWVFAFGPDANISVECLWRLVGDGRFIRSSEDHRHQFGLPAPVDAGETCRAALAGRKITNVQLREPTADIMIEFAGGVRLEIIPKYAGYESWHLSTPSGREYAATPGGRISTWMRSQRAT